MDANDDRLLYAMYDREASERKVMQANGEFASDVRDLNAATVALENRIVDLGKRLDKLAKALDDLTDVMKEVNTAQRFYRPPGRGPNADKPSA